ncbi:MAG: ribonuclease D [Candidatus Nitronauta litoralis]|uniref:Ribonuclease D n=1 Tax=Candidatus Nitronauta litoralis TaxID=2705533 RepID=A0A7T0BXM4_9BACT|nr:MAG: ribonuclease D [Candidatus Nitronauta litoralis]
MYITTPEQLAEFCEKLGQPEMMAIDTEFVREKTYYHRLGLVQVGAEGHYAAIDPISIKDLTPLLNLIANPETLKVFHAGKQDLEILYNLMGEAVNPIFDTQIAASLLGWGGQISFAKVVKRVTGKTIHKTETYSDWCRRPLSKSQIDYAIDDVRYLVPVYEYLVKSLEKMGRLDWLEEEFLPLTDPKNFTPAEPSRQFMRIKNFRTLKPRNLAVLCELAAWREEEAMRRDCLAKFIIRDEPLLEMARKTPGDIKALEMIRGIHGKEIKNSGKKILKAIERGLEMPEENIPKIPESNSYSTRRGVEELLIAYVQVRSEDLKIEPHVLADRKQIHDFVKRHELKENLEGHSLLSGWRHTLIGAELHDMLTGKAGLSINDQGRVVLVYGGSEPSSS